MRALLFLLALPLSAPAATVTFAWNAVSTPAVAYYRLFTGPTSMVYSATNTIGGRLSTNFTGNFQPGVHYAKLTAVTTNDIESDPSNEASFVMPPPPALIVQGGPAGSLSLAWGPSISGVDRYRLRLGTNSGAYDVSQVVTGRFTTNVIIQFNPGTYYGRVSAISTNNVEGDASAEVQFVVPPAPTGFRIEGAFEGAPTPTGPWSTVSNLIVMVEATDERKFFRTKLDITRP